MPNVRPPGFGEREASLRFRFDGHNAAAAPGESVAAALAAAGELRFRETRTGERRGPFCGMGSCHECLVAVEGRTLRACLTPAVDGMIVERHHVGLPKYAAAPAEGPPPLACDILVVGGGPAGLSAALQASRLGRHVVLLDERAKPGGQFWKQPAGGTPVQLGALDAQFRAGRAMIAAAQAADVAIVSGASVFAPHGADSLLAETPDGPRRFRAKRIILATGAVESCPPFPGWTLPGVMTTGAAQTFLRAHGVAPGDRILIAGAGPLNLQLAAELTQAGAKVVGVAEASSGIGWAKLPALAAMAATAPLTLTRGVGYLARLAAAGVPVWTSETIRAALGEGRVEAARIGDREIACDALCLGYGFSPAVELAASMGCALRYDERRRHLTVATDGEGRTSLPHVFAVGDGARFGGAAVAQAAGGIAGLRAAADLAPSAQAERLIRRMAWRRRNLHDSFQRALWRLYDAPPLGLSLAAADTLVCRCEHVSLAAVEAAVAAGATGLGALKRATRLGMGRCQGRYCAGPAAALLAERSGRQPEPEDFFAPRTPLRPVRIGTVAALDLGDAP